MTRVDEREGQLKKRLLLALEIDKLQPAAARVVLKTSSGSYLHALQLRRSEGRGLHVTLQKLIVGLGLAAKTKLQDVLTSSANKQL